MERFWLKHYPSGVPADVDVDQYASLVQLMDAGFAKFASRNAYSFMDRFFTFADIERHSASFGAWLQGLGLARGARIAIMMPNVVQYPIAVAGILRAGYVVVDITVAAGNPARAESRQYLARTARRTKGLSF